MPTLKLKPTRKVGAACYASGPNRLVDGQYIGRVIIGSLETVKLVKGLLSL